MNWITFPVSLKSLSLLCSGRGHEFQLQSVGRLGYTHARLERHFSFDKMLQVFPHCPISLILVGPVGNCFRKMPILFSGYQNEPHINRMWNSSVPLREGVDEK